MINKEDNSIIYNFSAVRDNCQWLGGKLYFTSYMDSENCGLYALSPEEPYLMEQIVIDSIDNSVNKAWVLSRNNEGLNLFLPEKYDSEGYIIGRQYILYMKN